MTMRLNSIGSIDPRTSESVKSTQTLWPVALLLIIGLYGYALRAIGFFEDIPGDLGDARFNSVVLEHVYRWAIGHASSLWSAPYFYPFPDVIAFSDNHFGSSPVYILFRGIGLDRELAFASWFLFGCVANFFAAYWALRRIGLTRFGSGIGAFVFAFALPALPREGHAQLIYRFAIPLCFAYFIDLLRTRDVHYARQVCIFLAWQFFCSIYLGIFLTYLLAATMLAYLVMRSGWSLPAGLVHSVRNSPWQKTLWTVLVAVASGAAVASLLYKYHNVSQAYQFVRPVAEVSTMLPRPGSYLLAEGASLTSWLGRYVDAIPMRHEHQLFFGFAVIALAALGFAASWIGRSHSTLGRNASIVLLMLFAGTLFVGGHSLYVLVLQVPGLGAVRAVTRIVLVMLLPMGILAGIGGQWLLARVAGDSLSKAIAASLVLVLLCGVEIMSYHSNKTPIAVWRERQHVLQSMWPAGTPRDSILLVTKRMSEPRHFAELDGVIFAQDHGLDTLNGYSGNFPPGYLEPFPCLTTDFRVRSYLRFSRQPQSAADGYLSRLKVLPLERCEGPVMLPFYGKVDRDVVSQLRLSVAGLDVHGGSAKARIRLENPSNGTFNTLSGDGNSVFVSWRFVPVGTFETSSAQVPWDTRGDLQWTLRPGEARESAFDVTLPTEPGRYVFQASLVQESVAWLHDLGMVIPGVAVEVGNSSGPDEASRQSRQIRLSLDGVRVSGGVVHARVRVVNDSAQTFNAFSEGATPVRVSWKLVASSGTGIDPGWSTRKDLPWNIPAGGEAYVEIEAPLSGATGDLRLEATLVREFVAWLHDQGMKTASADVVAR